MKYISTAQAAAKWQTSSRWVSNLAKDGRIRGAVQIGNRWMIPADSERPIDGRTKSAKTAQSNADFFRYPIFAHRNLSSFDPPLTGEELQFKAAQEAFQQGLFEKSEKLLPVEVKNRYLKIAVLHARCSLDIFLCNSRQFFDHYGMLCNEVQGDIDHQREMLEFIYMIDATLGTNQYYDRQFEVSATYDYHQSYLPHLASLAAVSLSFAEKIITPESLRTHEVNCRLLELTDAYVEQQSLHIYLGTAYCFLKRFDDMTYHFKKALELTQKYELYYVPALQYYYIGAMFNPALKCFPKQLKIRLKQVSTDIHTRYQNFMDSVSFKSIYKLLSHKDYFYLYSAVQGHTNKEVASHLNVSMATVANKYRQIYNTLGVDTKAEMIELYQKSIGTSCLFKSDQS